MKRSVLTMIIVLATALLCQNVCAQSDFDKFKQQRDRDFKKYREKTKRDFEKYRDQRNAEYAEFVKKAWREMDAMRGKSKPKEEKKPVAPVVAPKEDQDKPVKNNEKPIEVVVTPPAPAPAPKPIAPIEEVPTPKPEVKYFSFTSLATPCKVRIDPNKKFKLASVNEKGVAQVWTTLSSDTYTNALADLLALRKNMQLCDWAYLTLLNDFGAAFCGKGTNEARLLTAYMYNQSGYQMRLAFSGQKVEMLFASRHEIFETPYWTMDNTNYYAYWDRKNTNVRVCQATMEGAQGMSLYINSKMEIGQNYSSARTIKSIRYPDVAATVSVNKNMMDFYNTYPSSMVNSDQGTRWAMYANTPISDHVRNTLYPAIRERIKGLNDLAAVERILNWIQTGFEYEYDDKVWGGDRAFFPEETLFYPYCDCEDRSILLSRIVRDLLGLKVVLIYYPGHLAAAIHFNTDVAGDYIVLKGQKYVIADPTYIGAAVGRTMPNMDNGSAKVICLE